MITLVRCPPPPTPNEKHILTSAGRRLAPGRTRTESSARFDCAREPRRLCGPVADQPQVENPPTPFDGESSPVTLLPCQCCCATPVSLLGCDSERTQLDADAGLSQLRYLLVIALDWMRGSLRSLDARSNCWTRFDAVVQLDSMHVGFDARWI